LIAILSGFAISFMGESGRPILGFIDQEELRANLRNALSLAEPTAEDAAKVEPLAPGT
jgi:hypothetical protein